MGQGQGKDEKLTSRAPQTPPPGGLEAGGAERRRRPRSQEVGDDDEDLSAWEASFVLGRERDEQNEDEEPTRAEPPAPDSDLVLDVTDELGFAATPIAGEPAVEALGRPSGAAGFDRDLRLDADLVEISPASFGFRPSAFELDPEVTARTIAEASTHDVSGDEVFRVQLHTLVGELGIAAQNGASPEERARLATAAARAAERLGGADALRFYQEALAAAPDFAPAQRGLFRLSWQAGMATEALAAARALAAALPEEAPAYGAVIAEAEAAGKAAPSGNERITESDDFGALLRTCEATLRGDDRAAAAARTGG
jgi:hypothetical protein